MSGAANDKGWKAEEERSSGEGRGSWVSSWVQLVRATPMLLKMCSLNFFNIETNNSDKSF